MRVVGKGGPKRAARDMAIPRVLGGIPKTWNDV